MTLNPDLVGITMSATEHSEGLEIARLAKAQGAVTVLGGYHPTAIPDELLSHSQVDMVVRGEGEITMRELVEKGGPQGVRGISYREDGQIIHNPDREFIEDLDSLPFPARHLRKHAYRNKADAGSGVRCVDNISGLLWQMHFLLRTDHEQRPSTLPFSRERDEGDIGDGLLPRPQAPQHRYHRPSFPGEPRAGGAAVRPLGTSMISTYASASRCGPTRWRNTLTSYGK